MEADNNGRPSRHPKSRLVYAIALILGGCGVIAILAGLQSFLIRSLGLVGLIVSLSLVRLSQMDATLRAAGRRADEDRLRKPLPIVLWAAGVASVLLFAFACLALYLDALGGYRTGWPVYLFGGATLVSAVVTSYIVARLLN